MQFNDCEFTVSGEHGNMKIISKEKQNNEEDWEKLEKFFTECLQRFDSSSSGYIVSDMTLTHIKDKNKRELKNLIAKYTTEFTKNICCGVAASGIFELLKNIVK